MSETGGEGRAQGFWKQEEEEGRSWRNPFVPWSR